MSKRMNGEGLIRRRPDGRYELRIMEGYQKNGKQKVVSFYGKTKKEVREKKKAYDAGAKQGVAMKAKYTFSEFADVWFERYASLNTALLQSDVCVDHAVAGSKLGNHQPSGRTYDYQNH